MALLVPLWSALAALVLIYLMEQGGYRSRHMPTSMYFVIGVPGAVFGLIAAAFALSRREYVQVDEEGLRFPGSLLPWRICRLSYSDITSYSRLGGGRTATVAVTWKGLLTARAFGRRTFVAPDGVERLDAALSEGLARHPQRQEMFFREALARRMRRIPRLCVAVAVILLSVYAWQVTRVDSGSAVGYLLSGALSPWLTLHQGEWHRLAVASLLHGGWLHIILNLVSLLALGMMLEPVLGRWRLLLVMLVSAAMASLASALASVFFASVGFSGGIFGMLGASVALRLRFRYLRPSGLRTEALVLVMLSLSMFSDWLSMQSVDHGGHLAGMVTGALLGVTIGDEGELREGVHRPSRVLVAVVVLSSALWGLAAAKAVHYRASHDRGRLVEELLQNPDPGRKSRKLDYATVLASATLMDHDAGLLQLERARVALSAAVEHSPTSADSLAVLAGLQYVLGDPQGAAASARRVLAMEGDGAAAEFVAELSLYEWRSDLAGAGAGVPDEAGVNGALVPTVVDDAPGTADVLTLTSPIAHPKGLLAHVLVLEGDELRGFLWLRFGAFRGGPRHFAEGWSELRGDRELRYHVTYFTRLSERLKPGTWLWRYWPWEPESVELIERRAAALRESAQAL